MKTQKHRATPDKTARGATTWSMSWGQVFCFALQSSGANFSSAKGCKNLMRRCGGKNLAPGHFTQSGRLA
jgi:hypothetical protein